MLPQPWLYIMHAEENGSSRCQSVWSSLFRARKWLHCSHETAYH